MSSSPASTRNAGAVRDRLRTGFVLLSVVLIGLAVPIRGSEGQPRPTPAPSEALIVRMAPSPEMSIRAQTVNAEVLYNALNRWTWSSTRRLACGFDVLLRENNRAFYLTTSPYNPARRAECWDQIVDFVLRGTIDEQEFIVARSKAAEFIASLVNPHLRDLYGASQAARRLAFLLIYKPGSPLHEIYSIDETDYAKLTFGQFNQWLEESRRDGRLTIDPAPRQLDIFDLAGITTNPASDLPPSARVPAGTFSFDGERFGVAALVLLKVPIGHNLRQFPIWNRFSCNLSESVPSDRVGAPASIASIHCSSYSISDADAWFSLALRKDEDAEYGEFCRDVDSFLHDPDLLTVIRDLAREPYVFLSPRCEEAR